MRIRALRRWLRIAPVASLALLLGAHASAEGRKVGEPRAVDDGPRIAVVLAGRVLARDGAPAQGAVVVSSAGGRALTDASGNYRLAVEVPLDASSVQVSAVGPTHQRASTSVGLSSASGSASVGPLFLGQDPFCAEWRPTFGQLPGTAGSGGNVLALAEFDDGGGPALYAGGTFRDAGGSRVNGIAKWDGSHWSKLGSGINGNVLALAVSDGPHGQALYAGGTLTVGGLATDVAMWDGSSWSALGSGMDGMVRALAVFDDGSGPALYAGGDFAHAGGNPANHLAKWDGSTWTGVGGGTIGDGTVGSVWTLLACDLGGGPELVVGGSFQIAGTTAHNIASWNGSSWSVLADGLSSTVETLAQWDDGSGPALYAGGNFVNASGVTVNHVAKWDGTSWSALANGTGSSIVFALAGFDDGSGPALYAGGNITNASGVPVSHVAKWDGSSWSAVPGMDGWVHALAVHDDGDGPRLFAGGEFVRSGGVVTNHVARSAAGSWEPLGQAPSAAVLTLDRWNDGSGEAVYAGGQFEGVGGVVANHIAKWEGASWSALASGTDGPVYALAEFDDGSGSALYAAGQFDHAGGVPAGRIARWDGASWSPLNDTPDGFDIGGGALLPTLGALAVFDAGSGPELYAGGSFNHAGSSSAHNIARWDGTSWSALGSGLAGGGTPEVFALTIFDDGSGPALYVGGVFQSAGGVPANCIAKWDGASWSALGSGTDGGVDSLAVFDDGSGPALYVGGSFGRAGGILVHDVAKWDGTSWSALGSGLSNGVEALTVHDDGSGPKLYAGGGFTPLGGVGGNHVARWDGASWSAFGGGCDGTVNALLSFGDAPALYAGGSFQRNVDSGDSFLAVWACDITPPVLTHPPAVFALDRLGSAPGEVVTFSVTASDDEDPSPIVVCVPPSGSVFPLGTTIVSCTATDASGNSSHGEFPVTVRSQFQQQRR